MDNHAQVTWEAKSVVHRYQKQASVALESEEEREWKKAYGTAMTLKRTDVCAKVREGLAKLAQERNLQAARIKDGRTVPLSPGRERPPPFGRLRPLPTSSSFPYFQPQDPPHLPICSQLWHNYHEDQSVWRRTDYY